MFSCSSETRDLPDCCPSLSDSVAIAVTSRAQAKTRICNIIIRICKYVSHNSVPIIIIITESSQHNVAEMRAKTFQNISCLSNWYTIVKRIQIFYSVSQQSHGFIVSRIFAVTPWSVKKGLLFYAYCGRSARRDVKFINSDDIPTTVLNVITRSASIMVNGFPRFWWDTRHDGRQERARRIYLQCSYIGWN